MEVDDLKKITNTLTVLCSEKQKQEKVRAACVSAAEGARVANGKSLTALSCCARTGDSVITGVLVERETLFAVLNLEITGKTLFVYISATCVLPLFQFELSWG